MSEFKVGDKVWIEAEVIDIVGDAVRVRADLCDESFWVNAGQCKPVEPESNPPITKEDVSVVDRYCELVRSQSDFAWTIFCNLAVMAQDAGAPHKESNERAADMMKYWFGVDVRKFEQWSWKPIETAKPDPYRRPFQVGDIIEVCNPHLGTHGHRGVVTEVLDGLASVKININNCWFVLSYKSLRLVKPEPDPVVEQTSTTEPEAKRPETTATHYGPDISKVSFEFTQDPNTLGTTDASGCGSEYLTVECEYQLPGEEPFFVIRTTSGWSFDDPEALLALLNSVKDAEKKCRCSLPQS
jgi:hypothetical protein